MIGICGCLLIAAIICRCFLQSVLQLSDKISGSEKKSYCVGLRIKTVATVGSKLEAGCQESANQKMSISCSRREKTDSLSKTAMRICHDEDKSSVSCDLHVATALGYTSLPM